MLPKDWTSHCDLCRAWVLKGFLENLVGGRQRVFAVWNVGCLVAVHWRIRAYVPSKALRSPLIII